MKELEKYNFFKSQKTRRRTFLNKNFKITFVKTQVTY